MSKALRSSIALLAATILVAASCAAQGDDEGASEEPGSTAEGEDDGESSGGDSGDGSFADLEGLCAPGDYTIAADENAGSPDKLLLGVSNDRTSQIRPGLNKEMWDSSNAFVEWCNEQGGIGGLEIEIVDLDGKLLEVESAMAKACNGVFMMVGGGQVQDNLQFTGKPDSDFHQCGLAEIPGFTVSPEKSESNGQIQPIPHPGDEVYAGWIRDAKELYPEDLESMVELWGELPSMETIKNQTVASLEAEGVEVAGDITYPVTGQSDWTPTAQQVIATGATSMHFTGEPTNLGAVTKSLREQGWDGRLVLETNMYDQQFIDSAGVANAEGAVIKSAFHPLEEAADWPATQRYMDIVNQYVDDPKFAVLGMQSFSAWLLFAAAANDCAESNDGELSRECVLKAADAIDDWTGGGLHAPTDPGPEGGPSAVCNMLVTVNSDGGFERLYPEVGSDADDGEGFSCHEDGIAEVPENAGLGITSPDQPI